jgi:ubiquinone/menaquinone biosynthesis C-methylase UbiE
MRSGESKNVYKEYDQIADWFAANRSKKLIEQIYLDAMLSHLPKEASILDLGCGTGMPILNYLLSKKMFVTGVDASKAMLDIAKVNFPNQEFILQDMRNLKLDKRFDGIIAWHSFFHLPVADQPEMFRLFAKHLKPNGIILFTSGTELSETWGMNGGKNLFHASLETSTYNQLLKKNDFEVISHTVDDEDCGGATVWMARLT